VLAVVDTGPLYAVADADDDDHERCREVLANSAYRLVVPALVVAEVTYLIGTRLGAKAEATFLRSLTEVDVELPALDDWPRIAELVDRYRNLPLGGTDASVVALAERLETDVVITLDRRDFSAVRPRHRRSFRLLP
jgi:predicted nucleic acid-binding protein